MKILLSAILSCLRTSNGFVPQRAPKMAPSLSAAPSQLEHLSKITTLSIDSGDLEVIKKYADTGFITDATTNPLFVSQAGLSG